MPKRQKPHDAYLSTRNTCEPPMGKIGYLMMVHREAIMYVIMGGFTTLVTWASYAGFVHFGIAEEVSNVLSWICGVVFAFVVNKWFVFNSKTLKPKELGREIVFFFGSRIFTLIVAVVAFPVLIDIGVDQELFGTPGMVAKIITSIIGIVLNWVLSKYLVFRRSKSDSA